MVVDIMAFCPFSAAPVPLWVGGSGVLRRIAGCDVFSSAARVAARFGAGCDDGRVDESVPCAAAGLDDDTVTVGDGKRTAVSSGDGVCSASLLPGGNRRVGVEAAGRERLQGQRDTRASAPTAQGLGEELTAL